MERITQLARLSVLRAWGFSGLAILMVMMGTASDLAASFFFGASGALAVSAAMTVYGLTYHRRRRVEDTEVWIMLAEQERPARPVARMLIVTAMRDQLLDKAYWSVRLALGLFAVSILLLLVSDRA